MLANVNKSLKKFNIQNDVLWLDSFNRLVAVLFVFSLLAKETWLCSNTLEKMMNENSYTIKIKLGRVNFFGIIWIFMTISIGTVFSSTALIYYFFFWFIFFLWLFNLLGYIWAERASSRWELCEREKISQTNSWLTHVLRCIGWKALHQNWILKSSCYIDSLSLSLFRKNQTWKLPLKLVRRSFYMTTKKSIQPHFNWMRIERMRFLFANKNWNSSPNFLTAINLEVLFYVIQTELDLRPNFFFHINGN